ncbi:hypothetical protein, partial [Phenylobacterium sp.]|uniref:hypothetical protein n=1 Tax=Phenylobacterium sp. TaxID=1871053 RepID=UPI0025F309DB
DAAHAAPLHQGAERTITPRREDQSDGRSLHGADDGWLKPSRQAVRGSAPTLRAPVRSAELLARGIAAWCRPKPDARSSGPRSGRLRGLARVFATRTAYDYAPPI